MPLEEKEEKGAKKEKTCRLQSQNGVDYGDPWGQIQSGKKKRSQAGTAGGLGSQSGLDNMGP